MLRPVRLLGRYIDRISEHPERPAAKSGKAGLAEKNFRPVAAGAGYGLVDHPGLLLGNLPPVAENFDQRDA